MTNKITNKYFPEVRERSVRMVLEHEGDHVSRWAAIVSISGKIGRAPQTLNEWVKKVEVDGGKRAGISTDMAEKKKALEREVRGLRQANGLPSHIWRIRRYEKNEWQSDRTCLGRPDLNRMPDTQTRRNWSCKFYTIAHRNARSQRIIPTCSYTIRMRRQNKKI